MNCYKIINAFWRMHNLVPFSPVEFAVFHYIVRRYDVSRGVNPIAIPTRDFEVRLRISRTQLSHAREALFFVSHNEPVCVNSSVTNSDSISKISNKSNVSIDSNESLTNDEEEKNLKKAQAQNFEISESKCSEPEVDSIELTEKNISDRKESCPQPSLSATKILSNNPLPGDADLARFDALMAEVQAGKHDIWCDQMAKKHHIDSAKEYLDAFRSHVICNARLDSIQTINDFKRYFNLAFRYFSVKTPEQKLAEYEASAPESSVKYRKFCSWMREQKPYLACTLEPLSESDFNYLFHTYGKDDVFEAVHQLDNHPKTVERQRALCQSIVDWLERRKRSKR